MYRDEALSSNLIIAKAIATQMSVDAILGKTPCYEKESIC
jgi:hypothetical protein